MGYAFVGWLGLVFLVAAFVCGICLLIAKPNETGRKPAKLKLGMAVFPFLSIICLASSFWIFDTQSQRINDFLAQSQREMDELRRGEDDVDNILYGPITIDDDRLTEEQRAEIEEYLEQIREEALSGSGVDDEYSPPADGWSSDVSMDMEFQLSLIAEDMAKQTAQNSSTVRMDTLGMGFAENGPYYAVQSEFECSSLLGVSENHTIRVVCKLNADGSKLRVHEVWLDEGLIAFEGDR